MAASRWVSRRTEVQRHHSNGAVQRAPSGPAPETPEPWATTALLHTRLQLGHGGCPALLGVCGRQDGQIVAQL